MTDNQKTQIIKLRAAGNGYGKIAQTLGISVNTVKSFCRRNDINGTAAVEPSVILTVETTCCENCGREIQQISKQKKKSFCCDKCRNELWNSHLGRNICRRSDIYLFSAAVQGCGGHMVGHDRGFCLTLEMLRWKPDSAFVWYEDFRDYGVLETNYWTVLSGSWEVWRSEEYSMERVYSQLDGSGQLAWKYDGFSDIHLRTRLTFLANGSGKAGVFCGDLFCCLNYDTQAVELYNGSTLLGSYSQEITRTATADLRDDPSMYTVEMRIRGNRVRVYSGSSYTLRLTATVIPVDINIWISRLFLGDADGFSILYYQDVDSLVYWANEAAYRWKLRGMSMWSLGQEALRLWEWLSKQV